MRRPHRQRSDGTAARRLSRSADEGSGRERSEQARRPASRLRGLTRGLAAGLGATLLSACSAEMLRPVVGLNRQLERLAPAREPVLSGRWLALIGRQGGRDRVLLVDRERGLPVPLPGLDRADAQPLAVAVDSEGERLAVVRQRESQTELVLYRRSLQTSEPLPMEPPGVPRRLSLRGDGRLLALEVSRGGRWQVDLINLP